LSGTWYLEDVWNSKFSKYFTADNRSDYCGGQIKGQILSTDVSSQGKKE
jgi:hypothetical protein